MRPAALTLALFTAGSARAAAPADTYAIVVGSNTGLPGGEGQAALPTLRYADDDALRFARFFGALGEVTLLVEPDADTVAQWARVEAPLPAHQAPTREALLTALAALTRTLQARPASAPPAAVYFVYAGHGLPGRFLLQGDGGAESSLTGRELVSAFAALPAGRATLFLDACRAQSLFSARGAEDFSADVAALEASASRVPLGILTAATSTTPAGETPRLRGGYFSHVLASALAGAADADGDHLVRFGELAAFVAFHTERRVGQRPWFEAPAGNLEAVVIDLRTRPTVTLGAQLEGRFRVAQAQGPIAEVRKAKGRPLELLVPQGDFTVLQEFEGQQRRAVVTDRGRAPLTLEAQAFTATQGSRGEEGAEPDDGFDAPFSSDAVSALSTGYQAGRAPLEAQGPFRFALAARYGLSSGLNFTAVEHGGELSFLVRAAGRLVLGPRVALRTSQFFTGVDGLARWVRASVLLEAGLTFAPATWLELTPLIGLGVKWVWRPGAQDTRADLSQPAMAAGLRVSALLSAHLALEVELRGEAALVSLDGERRLFAEPMGLVGLSWRWR